MTNTAGEKQLYQEGTLAANRGIMELLNGIPPDCVKPGEGFCLFCGTFPAIGGLRCGNDFEFELFDPILKRSIRHAYRLSVFPQYL